MSQGKTAAEKPITETEMKRAVANLLSNAIVTYGNGEAGHTAHASIYMREGARDPGRKLGKVAVYFNAVRKADGTIACGIRSIQEGA